MNISILLLVCLVLPKYIAATVHTVIAGDINDLISTLALVADYDTVLIPPGDYVFDDQNLCAAMPAVGYYPAVSPNLLIRGTGSSRSDVKLVAALFRSCMRNVVIENLSLYSVGASYPVQWQNSQTSGVKFGLMLRNIYFQVPVNSYPDYFINVGNPYMPLMTFSARIAVMYSTIETNPQVPSMGANTGLTEKSCDYGGCGLSVIRSTFAGFTKGLDLYLKCGDLGDFYNYTWCEANPDVDELNRNYKIYGNDLSQNTIPIDGDPTAISLLSPNTPKGQNYFVNTFIDILRYSSDTDAPYVPIKIRVKKAKKAGETTIYRVPSAYPEPLPGFISASEPQYYQFDSTAKFGSKSNVFFKKSDIQSKFPGFSGSLTCMYHNGTTWITVSHVVYGGWYKITFPKKQMKGLIAIFKN